MRLMDKVIPSLIGYRRALIPPLINTTSVNLAHRLVDVRIAVAVHSHDGLHYFPGLDQSRSKITRETVPAVMAKRSANGYKWSGQIEKNTLTR